MIRNYKIFLILFLLAILIASFFIFKNKTSFSFELNKDKKSSDVVINKEVSKEKVTVLFLGDLMFDRYIREVSEKRGNEFVFEKVRDLLSQPDLVLLNLEGPITDNASKSVGTEIGGKSHLVFTFNPSLSKTISEKNIKLVNLGNNHILNFGEEGLKSTEKYLDESGVKYFGDVNSPEIKNYILQDIKGVKIAFVNFNQFNLSSKNNISETIKNVRTQADFVVVYTHWGIEYETLANNSIKNLAHSFVDNGADLVIGSHPHVVQDKEEYKGKMIYYSLGNFVFDQYFDPNTQKGLGVKAEFDAVNKKINFQDVNLVLKNNGQTEVK